MREKWGIEYASNDSWWSVINHIINDNDGKRERDDNRQLSKQSDNNPLLI